jgi:hypothetical protein
MLRHTYSACLVVPKTASSQTVSLAPDVFVFTAGVAISSKLFLFKDVLLASDFVFTHGAACSLHVLSNRQ